MTFDPKNFFLKNLANKSKIFKRSKVPGLVKKYKSSSIHNFAPNLSFASFVKHVGRKIDKIFNPLIELSSHGQK